MNIFSRAWHDITGQPSKGDIAGIESQRTSAAAVADPWSKYRSGYMTRLNQFMNAPDTSATDVTSNPMYQFTLGQGIKAASRAAAAQGGNMSGRLLADITKYASGLAANTYYQQQQLRQQKFQNLFNLAGVGQSSPMAAAQILSGNAATEQAAVNAKTSGTQSFLGGALGMMSTPVSQLAPSGSMLSGIGSGISSGASGLGSFGSSILGNLWTTAGPAAAAIAV